MGGRLLRLGRAAGALHARQKGFENVTELEHRYEVKIVIAAVV